MSAREVVRTVRIQETGSDKAAASLNRLATAAGKTSTSLNKATASAADGARVYDRTARSAGSTETQLARLQRTVDRTFRDTERLAKAEAVLDTSFSKGLISLEQHAEILDLTRAKYVNAAGAADNLAASQIAMGRSAAVANDNVKLTGNQLQVLSFQANDIATSLASGMSPFTVMAQQSGQVVQALQMGPAGLGGSLKAIGASLLSLATPMNLAVAGFTAAAGAALYLSSTSKKGARDAETALESYEAVLKRLENGFKSAGDAAEEFFRKATRESAASGLAAIATERKALQADIKALDTELAGTLDNATRGQNSRGLGPALISDLRAIRDEIRAGTIDGVGLRDRLAEMKLRDDLPRPAEVLIKRMGEAVESLITAEGRMGALGVAADELSGKMGRLRIPSLIGDSARFGGATGLMGRLDPEGFDTLREGLKQQASELEEITRAEQNRQAIAALSLLTIRARTSAEREDIAAGMAAIELELVA